MKKFWLMTLLAMLICLPMGAMAETYDLSVMSGDGEISFTTNTTDVKDGGPFLLKSGDVITGSTNRGVKMDVREDMEITFRDVSIAVEGEESVALYLVNLHTRSTLTIQFEGNNNLQGENWDIASHGAALTLQGSGFWRLSGSKSIYNQESPDTLRVTLPPYAGEVPEGKVFKAWLTETKNSWDPSKNAAAEKQPGETMELNVNRLNIEPVFEDVPGGGSVGNFPETIVSFDPPAETAQVPRTGDNFSAALWMGLGALALAGMMMAAGKRKEV